MRLDRLKAGCTPRRRHQWRPINHGPLRRGHGWHWKASRFHLYIPPNGLPLYYSVGRLHGYRTKHIFRQPSGE